MIPCEIVFRSVGYRGVSLPGVPFDERSGTIPNATGRVLDEHGEPVPGAVRRGLDQARPDRRHRHEQEGRDGDRRAPARGRAGGARCRRASAESALDELLAERGVDVVMYAGWESIDALERSPASRTAARASSSAPGTSSSQPRAPETRCQTRGSSHGAAVRSATPCHAVPESDFSRATRLPARRGVVRPVEGLSHSRHDRPDRNQCLTPVLRTRAARLDRVSETTEDSELWGAETRKAVANFPVSGEPIPTPVARWLGRIKAAAARVNAELGLLDAEVAERIAAAADRVAAGRARRPVPDRRLPDGLGHELEHERERGHRRARRRRRARERPREHGPVLERRLPVRRPPRGARRARQRPASRARDRSPRRSSARQPSSTTSSSPAART